VKKEFAEILTDAIASELAKRPGFEITTSRDIAARLGYQRQQQLMGTASCGDNVECMMEIGNALGVDKIAFGSVARVGESALLNTTVVSLHGNDVVRHSERVKNVSEEAFLDAIVPSVEAMFPVGASGSGPVASVERSAWDGTHLNVTVRGQLSPLSFPSGAWVAHVDYEFNESISAGLGVIAARPFGAFARVGWVPFNAHGRVRPLIALEVPVLFASSPAFGVGAAVGVEFRLLRNFAVGVEVPFSYYFGGPPELTASNRFWVFGALTLSGRL
jgi:hypothetical protein